MRARLALPVAVACGAVAAGAAAYVALPHTARTARIAIPAAQLRPAYELADRAASPATLRPIVVSGGRGRLGSGPAGVYEQSRPAAPAWLSIPAVSIEAPIDPVAGTATGIEVPAVGRAG